MKRYNRVRVVLSLGVLVVLALAPLAALPTQAQSGTSTAAEFPWPYGLGDDMMPPPPAPPQDTPAPPVALDDYTVTPVLFVPSDLTPIPDALDALDRQMRSIQRWYGEQLRTRTFTLEPARVVVGEQPLQYYYGDCYPPRAPCTFTAGYTMWNLIWGELDRRGYAWQPNRVTGVFYQTDGVGATALGGGNRFMFGPYIFGDSLQAGSMIRVAEGAVAHELGHAFGLPHPEPEGDVWNRSIMGYGYIGYPSVTFVNTSLNPERDHLLASPFMHVPASPTNSGFEDGLAGWQVQSGSATAVESAQRSGVQALELRAGGSTPVQVAQTLVIQEQQIYDLSGWLTMSEMAADLRVQVKVIVLNDAGNILVTLPVYNTAAVPRHEWERFSTSAHMPVNARYAQLVISVQGSAGRVIVDDVAWNLSTRPPGAAFPMFYLDDAAVPAQQPLLQWSDVTDATSFTVQLAGDDRFTTQVEQATVSAPFYQVMTKLSYNTRYFWRVKAANGTGETLWSRAWSFVPRTTAGYYSDEFEQSALGSAWSWVREDPGRWWWASPLNRRPSGYLGIEAQAGDLIGSINNARNLLLRNAPAGDFEVSTQVDWWGPPSANYQQGGVFIYQNDDNYIKIVHGYNNGFNVQFLAEVNGQVVASYSTPIVEVVPMKLARVGNVYTASYSPDGFSWRQLGQPVTVGWSSPCIGLGAFSYLPAPTVTAYFDWFRVQTPRTPSEVPGPSGLIGAYYDNTDFTGIKLTRLDPAVNFAWGYGSPNPMLDSSTFAVRWTGQLVPRFSERYTFFTQNDDGVRLWVNNQLVIDDWQDHGLAERTGTMNLQAGVPVTIRLDYYESHGQAAAKLLWASPSQPKEVIPASQLRPAPGLIGAYYDNLDFTNLKLTRQDPTVNFSWGYGAPDPTLDASMFAVRWTGQLIPRFSERYTFFTQNDDGVRLWVNDQLVIDDWQDHGLAERQGVISLHAGVPVRIRLDYYENHGQAAVKLLWASPSQPQQIIPASQLLPPQ